MNYLGATLKTMSAAARPVARAKFAGRRSMKALAVASVVSLCAPPALAADVNFDAFLGGLERCERSDAFASFHQAIIDRYYNDAGRRGTRVRRNVPVPIPAAVREGVGAAKPRNRGEYTEVAIPLSGRFRGLALASLDFAVGNENGIGVVTLRFREPRARVEEAFGATFKEVMAARKPDEEFVVGMTRDGGPAFECNRSN
jgi:hypothetical protein